MPKTFQHAFDDLTNEFRRLRELDDEDFVLRAWRKVEAAGHAFFACLRAHPELWEDCPDYLKREPIWEAKDEHHEGEGESAEIEADSERPWDLYWYATLSWMEGRKPETLVKLGGASSHCKYPGQWPDWSPVEGYSYVFELLGQGADDAGFYRIIVEASEAACRYLHRQLCNTESAADNEPQTNGVSTSNVDSKTTEGDCYILGGDAQPAVGAEAANEAKLRLGGETPFVDEEPVIERESRVVAWRGRGVPFQPARDYDLFVKLHDSPGRRATYIDLFRVIKPSEVGNCVEEFTEVPDEVKIAMSRIRKALKKTGCPWGIENERDTKSYRLSC